MPELPEVEVVKQSLEKKITNLTIEKVKINDGKLRYKLNRHKILKIVGKKINKIQRRSKFLIFSIGKDLIMLVHLGMTGKFYFANKKNKKFKTSFYYNIHKERDDKYNRVIFFLQNNQKLIYNDVRKFGFIKLFNTKKFEENFHLKNLGPEPLGKRWNSVYFKNYIQGRKRTIKDILMDQRFISGLGNIYVNEVLFLSGIKPTRKVIKLKNIEIDRLILNIKKTLKIAIRLGGSSIKDFSSSDGKGGNFQQLFKVYGRKGELCSNVDCNAIIERIIISNRSSFFCKKCQK
ncbi:MAG: bifunctional DNA-formamidopyrimidine glycosylase/DNA-(apurinic or apyrimidinic site) lyase [Pseudomonadota bacterium]|nr:bifunctional DNA-formamidopyrimidine glycosylase/DNA-(apurinic or apyrimidinic site) lyase [Pseudomonadota bacterium]